MRSDLPNQVKCSREARGHIQSQPRAVPIFLPACQHFIYSSIHQFLNSSIPQFLSSSVPQYLTLQPPSNPRQRWLCPKRLVLPLLSVPSILTLVTGNYYWWRTSWPCNCAPFRATKQYIVPCLRTSAGAHDIGRCHWHPVKRNAPSASARCVR